MVELLAFNIGKMKNLLRGYKEPIKSLLPGKIDDKKYFHWFFLFILLFFLSFLVKDFPWLNHKFLIRVSDQLCQKEAERGKNLNMNSNVSAYIIITDWQVLSEAHFRALNITIGKFSSGNFSTSVNHLFLFACKPLPK